MAWASGLKWRGRPGVVHDAEAARLARRRGDGWRVLHLESQGAGGLQIDDPGFRPDEVCDPSADQPL